MTRPLITALLIAATTFLMAACAPQVEAGCHGHACQFGFGYSDFYGRFGCSPQEAFVLFKQHPQLITQFPDAARLLQTQFGSFTAATPAAVVSTPAVTTPAVAVTTPPGTAAIAPAIAPAVAVGTPAVAAAAAIPATPALAIPAGPAAASIVTTPPTIAAEAAIPAALPVPAGGAELAAPVAVSAPDAPVATPAN